MNTLITVIIIVAILLLALVLFMFLGAALISQALYFEWYSGDGINLIRHNKTNRKSFSRRIADKQ